MNSGINPSAQRALRLQRALAQSRAMEARGDAVAAVSDPMQTGGVAFFQAQIFSGEEVFPVVEARVTLKRSGEIEAFLLTDESGQTQLIETAAPPRANSLEPENPNKSLDFTADVAAEGFQSLRELLVSQVGTALSLLNVNLTPLPEVPEI